jgi:uncharacterized phage protein (TIGR01671 family)
MREIKFRAWDKEEKRMVEESEVMLWGNGAWGAYREGNEEWTSEGVASPEPYTDNDMVLMQYTGLQDKKGNEVWEGDLLSLWDGSRILEVRWGRVGWVLFGDLFKRLGFLDGDECSEYHTKNYLRECEVIGNIYENPELAGGTKKGLDLEG